MGKLNGKVVLITGGGQGIGFGLAEAFAEAGANLVITGRTLSKLERAKEKIEGKYSGIKVAYFVADGSNEEEVKAALEGTVKEFGRLDTVINNAQNSASGVTLVDHTVEDFDKAIYSGLYATFFYMKHAFKYLKESKGSVINFATGAGLSGRAGQSSYAAAKEGIRGLSRVAATEWGPDGVRVNVVCPLVMTEGLIKWKEEYPELYEKTIQSIPLGRMGDPKDDIGRVCVFLSSDDASYLTGETITLQGGSGLRP
ncbi:NAD(P)-dependent dehydrogenase, short-chain alcohol dehydrogenase family [Anaerosphaera aminiphila DSM 21120]|uniref:NAD(P)-dependent dehydrogenase, short-chain alcohol dehydrogenase family n=1 Tax=Anaerosphaera aminiphila DSM 21120 TaxID=1120995 RepID=A0A1M5QM37_9FIRM|nr:SDR family NAD(P)-dependent oxidoreductase [Anaerosphaera aminiphila]SHH14790.1 NAD(P)-dependent dehydrogenase, short-chain alcohol dehydrogenase family [Anaerosphaera aminiphila DSM 21120]